MLAEREESLKLQRMALPDIQLSVYQSFGMNLAFSYCHIPLYNVSNGGTLWGFPSFCLTLHHKSLFRRHIALL